MDYFLTYAGSVSFRELKNVIKKYFFLNLGGVGAKTRFLSKKNWGRILGLAGKNIGSACLIYMGERHIFIIPHLHFPQYQTCDFQNENHHELQFRGIF